MDRVRRLLVKYNNRIVGTMALYDRVLVAFEYHKDWLLDGFSISPYSLPLEQRVFIPKMEPFDGLFGVFSDSLPDGWGRLLVDRLLLKNGMDPHTISSLERLAIVGQSGMGALTYEPDLTMGNQTLPVHDLDYLAKECQLILSSKDGGNLDELFLYGGSSGGARPKILTQIDDEDWLIKFPSAMDQEESGIMEYDYSICAKKCGIEMAETRLFESNLCGGYFGTKRFDRLSKKGKVHMISVSGLLETSHRYPNLDYSQLFQLTVHLTKDYSELMKLYRLMCFNVYAHNRDDHSKNFSYVYKDGRWALSPSYDLTYSHSIGGEHATTVNGNGKNPGLKDLLAIAKQYGLRISEATSIAKAIEEIVSEDLGKYLK